MTKIVFIRVHCNMCYFSLDIFPLKNYYMDSWLALILNEC